MKKFQSFNVIQCAFSILSAFAIMSLCATVSSATVKVKNDTPLPPGLEENRISAGAPVTFEEKMTASQLVARGIVEEIYSDEVPPETNNRKTYHNVNSTREKLIAVIKVSEVYKGQTAADSIAVEFIRSNIKENPVPVDFSIGEDVVVFLSGAPGDKYYSLIDQFTGKIPGYEVADRDAVKKTEVTGRKPTDENAAEKVTANVMIDDEKFTLGTPVTVTALLLNNSKDVILTGAEIDPKEVFEITGPKGEKLPFVSSSHIAPPPDTVILRPQHFIGARFDLSKHFKFSAPGKYTIKAVFLCIDASKDKTANTFISQPVSFTVESGKP